MKAQYVDHMGSDLSVVNAARVSFDKKSDWEQVDCGHEDCGPECSGSRTRLSKADTKLINYLAKHDHWTPFAHTAISLRMRAPIPIRTQCFKHKQGLVENEESRRYINSEPEVYHPKIWRKASTGSAKQGSSDQPIEGYRSLWGYETIYEDYDDHVNEAVSLYLHMLDSGVCPEQARFVLPQGCFVNWIWTGNVYSFANFYKKRTDPNAQREVSELALAVGKVIKPLFPVSWAALTDNITID